MPEWNENLAVDAPITNEMATDINVAASFRGRPTTAGVLALSNGHFMADGQRFIVNQLQRKWTDGTIANKARAVVLFKAFLRTLDLEDEILDPRNAVHDKTRARSVQEEALLAGFGLLRLLCGQTPLGAGVYISHIRTWYFHGTRIQLGLPGSTFQRSYASDFIRSCQEFFPIVKSDDEKRRPITLHQLQFLVGSATTKGDFSMAACLMVGFCGLFRMGEITATKGAFNPRKDLTEADVEFVPNYENATHVHIRIGASKADQLGLRARNKPRILSTTQDFLSPGRLLRQMFSHRQGNNSRQQPAQSANAPLFQRFEKQLTQQQVLTFIRATLRHRGYTETELAMYGTHSLRIGGFNQLYQSGCPIDIIKTHGGWSSDAWQVYRRIQHDQCMKYTSKMFIIPHSTRQ